MAATAVELSGEHPNLPLAEFLGCLRGLGTRPREVHYEPRFAWVRPATDAAVLTARLALGRTAGPVLLHGRLEDVLDGAPGLDLKGRRFRLRVADYAGTHDVPALEAAVGEALAASGSVDLSRPEVDLRLVCGHRACLYRVEGVVDRAAYEGRKGDRRPYFVPVSLHPRLARALVNLTGVAPGETLLDPFCGTGGLLMEAHLVGARPVGADLREEAVTGCRANLRALGMEARLHVADVGDLPGILDPVDAVATDPPYGRAATTRGEDLSSLMEKAFRTVATVLREGGRAAVTLPDPALMHRGPPELRLQEWHRLPVHRSLTRTLCVFEKG